MKMYEIASLFTNLYDLKDKHSVIHKSHYKLLLTYSQNITNSLSGAPFCGETQYFCK